MSRALLQQCRATPVEALVGFRWAEGESESSPVPAKVVFPIACPPCPPVASVEGHRRRSTQAAAPNSERTPVPDGLTCCAATGSFCIHSLPTRSTGRGLYGCQYRGTTGFSISAREPCCRAILVLMAPSLSQIHQKIAQASSLQPPGVCWGRLVADSRSRPSSQFCADKETESDFIESASRGDHSLSR